MTIRLLNSSDKLLKFLMDNSGDNADWPIDLVCRDKKHADELASLLNELKTAIDEAKSTT